MQCCCLVACLAMSAETNITTDQYSLLALKAHITFDPHGVLANWSTSTSICNWIGVTCGTHHLRVTSLDISNMALEGTIPPRLGNLSFLVLLDLSNNTFSGHMPDDLVHLLRLKFINLSFNKFGGQLPSWLGALTELQQLVVDNNSFIGTIPPSFSNMSKLETLVLSSNFLQGMIPREIGNLHNLKILDMQSNQLIGSVPLTIFNISSLKVISFTSNSISGHLPMDMCHRLSNLQGLYLSQNQFHGQIPSSLYECSELQTLSLSINKFNGPIPRGNWNSTVLKALSLGDNNFKGEIPSSMFNITSLKRLYLSENDLTGNLPSSIGDKLPNLEILDLADNYLNGILPNSISNASQLNILALIWNAFTGSIPNSLGNLVRLQQLSLGMNYFVSESPELSFLNSLTNCRQLRRLWVGDNPLNGILPASIGNLSTSLESIDVNYCGIKGNIPDGIGNLSNLAFFHLYNNDLSGLIPTTINGLRKLQVLYLQDNRIQGSIPEDLCNLLNLGLLELSKNSLSGPLPACLGNITSLRYLHLHSNRLTSSIPTSFWSLTNLMQLNLSSNSLSGRLPPEIGNLKVAILVDLSMNQFSGDIPSTIAGLQKLINLSFAHNRIQGAIPESFGNLLSLEFLDLSRNNLSGLVPKSLEALVCLKYFNVSFNRLRGEIPTGGPFTNFTHQSFMSNKALCGVPRFQVLPCDNSLHKSRKKRVRLVIYILLPIASILLALIFIFVFIRRRKRRNKMPIQTDTISAITHERITYHELLRATNGFGESNLLGMGSFGSVYRGILVDGTILAIKVFKLHVEGASRSFDIECEILRNIRHRNLTKVISSCSNLDFRALILKYMLKGSLEKWLHSHNYFLDIMQRLDIMIDVACALAYLHHDYSTRVVHCDLKPSNVLLDEDMVAHVSDFGIAKFLGQGESIALTKTLATFGYIAPEYGPEGLVSTRCDVYSYGIMLMETFTRRKPTDDIFAGDMSLKSWVNQSLPNAIIEVIDSDLLMPEEAHFTAKLQCLSSLMELAQNCSAESPHERINMKDAVVVLKKIKLQFLTNSDSQV